MSVQHKHYRDLLSPVQQVILDNCRLVREEPYDTKTNRMKRGALLCGVTSQSNKNPFEKESYTKGYNEGLSNVMNTIEREEDRHIGFFSGIVVLVGLVGGLPGAIMSAAFGSILSIFTDAKKQRDQGFKDGANDMRLVLKRDTVNTDLADKDRAQRPILTLNQAIDKEIKGEGNAVSPVIQEAPASVVTQVSSPETSHVKALESQRASAPAMAPAIA